MSKDTANWTAEVVLASSCTSLFLTLLPPRSSSRLAFGLHTLSGREVVLILAVSLFRIIFVVLAVVVFFLVFLFALFGGWSGFLARRRLCGCGCWCCWCCSSFCGCGCGWLGRRRSRFGWSSVRWMWVSTPISRNARSELTRCSG